MAWRHGKQIGDNTYNANMVYNEDTDEFVAMVYGIPQNITLESLMSNPEDVKRYGDALNTAKLLASAERLKVENEALKIILKDILNCLPIKRDWLDPDTEKAAKNLVQ